MRKIIILALIVLMIISVVPASAFASTNANTTTTEQTVKDIVKQNKLVTDSVVLVEKDLAVIAVKTKAISRTEYWDMKTNISNAVQQKLPQIKTVLVTNNPKVFYAITKLNQLSPEERSKQVEQLLDKLSKIPMPYFDGQKLPEPRKDK